MKALVVRCQAVGDGKAPVKWLTPGIDWILRTDVNGMKTLFYLACRVISDVF